MTESSNYDLPEPVVFLPTPQNVVFDSMKRATGDHRLEYSRPNDEYFQHLQKMEKELAEYASWELKAEDAWHKVEICRDQMTQVAMFSPAYESLVESSKDFQRKYSTAIRNADHHRANFKELVRELRRDLH